MKAALAVVLSVMSAASAQREHTVVLAPVKAHGFSGTVVDNNGGFLPRATVLLVDCPAGGHHQDAIATTETDAHGAFTLKPESPQKPFCIRVTAPGFDPLEFQLLPTFFAGRMRLALQPAR
jgi:hypothetical protein